MQPGLPFFWQPRGVIASLADLLVTDTVMAKHDVTRAVAGGDSPSHPLIVAELEGGKIIGDLRLVATADDRVIGGLQSIFGCNRPEDHYLLQRRRLRIPKYRRGRALLLGAANSDNYYHWLMESVPRWKILQAAGWKDYDYVLLHSKSAQFQEETLDRMQVPAAKRLRCSKNFAHQFERLVVPAMPFANWQVPAWATAWVRALFSNNHSGPQRIYLSRSGAQRRRLINEADLEARLQSLGFVCVQPEQLSVAGQAALFGSAKWIVAPHGASLTNAVFTPRGAKVLELFHPQYKNACYQYLAAACGHHYASLDGLATNRAGERHLEYTVDVSAVLERLESTI